MLALLSITCVAAMAFARLGASLQNDVPPGWPASGCLIESAEPLGAQVVIGRASLCSAADGIHGLVDLANLEPGARYIVWAEYMGNGRPCGLGPMFSQIQSSTPPPCALVDPEGHAAPVIVHAVAHRMADARGVFHVDEPVRAIKLTPHSKVWLMVAPPQWSPVPHPSYRLVEEDTSTPVARAVFDVP